MRTRFQTRFILSVILLFAVYTIGIVLLVQYDFHKFFALICLSFVIGISCIIIFGKKFGSRVSNMLSKERTKLLLHIRTSGEGVCFFSQDRTSSFYNSLFIQYYNIIAKERPQDAKSILSDPCFEQVNRFLDDRQGKDYFETKISSNGIVYMLFVNIFEDKSFEITITDITDREADKKMKQELTGNIAHEIRTPITSIRGFLEIVLNNKLSEEKEREYLSRAYSQTQLLSNLISDMSLLSKIDEMPSSFEGKRMKLSDVIGNILKDKAKELAAKHFSIEYLKAIPGEAKVLDIESIYICAAPSLLYSIFRNLTENSLNYAGEGVTIYIGAVNAAAANMVRVYFIDNGIGVPQDKNLDKIFDRFYRFEEGRSKDSGGSGLGLSIVKNSVKALGGSIIVRRHQPSGLEFLFTLPLCK